MNYTCCFNWHKFCTYLGDKRPLIPPTLQYFLSNPPRKIINPLEAQVKEKYYDSKTFYWKSYLYALNSAYVY